MTRFARLALALALLLVPACDADDRDPPSPFGVNPAYDPELGGPCESNADCPEAGYCEPGSAGCGAVGVCMPRWDMAMCEGHAIQPYCGCDGETYTNACEARASGVAVAGPGDC